MIYSIQLRRQLAQQLLQFRIRFAGEFLQRVDRQAQKALRRTNFADQFAFIHALFQPFLFPFFQSFFQAFLFPFFQSFFQAFLLPFF